MGRTKNHRHIATKRPFFYCPVAYFFVAANIANLLRNYDVGARAGTVDLLHGSTGTRRALPVAMSGAEQENKGGSFLCIYHRELRKKEPEPRAIVLNFLLYIC